MATFEALSAAAKSMQTESMTAMGRLGLEPGGFAWCTGSVEHRMPPQQLIPDDPRKSDSVSSFVTFYGGLIANEALRFSCGHVQGSVKEPTPEGTTHQGGFSQSPVPFIGHVFEVHNGVFTVGTPTVNPTLEDGPYVIEGDGHNPRFRQNTIYDLNTGRLTIRSGEYITDGRGISKPDDRTVEHDATELSEDTREARLAVMTRTIEAVTAIFKQIGFSSGNVRVKIQRYAPFRSHD